MHILILHRSVEPELFEPPWPSESLIEQQLDWPASGRHIMACFDDESIVVYQAYNTAIGHAAVADQALGGGGFSFERMSWIKPGFLWMMFRSGWATKPSQEVILAFRIRRVLFDEFLAGAVHSKFVAEVYGEQRAWKQAMRRSQVRLQWDPDHAPNGGKLVRRAIQLGLRREALHRFATEAMSIVDVTPFVSAQRLLVGTDQLVLPVERPYPVTDPATRDRLGLD